MKKRKSSTKSKSAATAPAAPAPTPRRSPLREPLQAALAGLDAWPMRDDRPVDLAACYDDRADVDLYRLLADIAPQHSGVVLFLHLLQEASGSPDGLYLIPSRLPGWPDYPPEAVARDFKLLRLTRWMTLCRPATPASVWVCHSAPSPVAETLDLDPGYLTFVETCATDENPRVREVARWAREDIAAQSRPGSNPPAPREPRLRLVG